MSSREKIPCSVGILTFNSEQTLRRTLESVKDFSDIIISDGGSTDKTLAIAKEYGATVIDQYAKQDPSKHADYPVDDFAKERNRMLDNAKESWFFWLDSDEYISSKLHEEVRRICVADDLIHYAYEIPIAHQSPDTSVTYQVWKQIYQVRFFNLQTGGRFERKMHERFVFDTSQYPVGRLMGAWYVPTSKQDFRTYKKAVNYRLGIMLAEAKPKNFFMYFKKAFWAPFKRSGGIVYRYLRLRLRYSKNEIMPLGYVRNRLYSQWVTFKVISQLYFKRKK